MNQAKAFLNDKCWEMFAGIAVSDTFSSWGYNFNLLTIIGQIEWHSLLIWQVLGREIHFYVWYLYFNNTFMFYLSVFVFFIKYFFTLVYRRKHRQEEEKENHNLPAEILIPSYVVSCDSNRGWGSS